MTTTEEILGADQRNSHQGAAGQSAGTASSAVNHDLASGGMSHRQILVVFSGLMLGMLLAALD